MHVIITLCADIRYNWIIANPPRDQLNRENEIFPAAALHAPEKFVSRNRFGCPRPALARSFSTPRLNPLLLYTVVGHTELQTLIVNFI